MKDCTAWQVAVNDVVIDPETVTELFEEMLEALKVSEKSKGVKNPNIYDLRFSGMRDNILEKIRHYIKEK